LARTLPHIPLGILYDALPNLLDEFEWLVHDRKGAVKWEKPIIARGMEKNDKSMFVIPHYFAEFENCPTFLWACPSL